MFIFPHTNNIFHPFCSAHGSDAFSGLDRKSPRHFPQEWSEDRERYTEEITAAFHDNNKNSLADRTHNIVAIDRMELMESETSPDPGWSYSERAAKQACDYHEGNFATPDNNLFFEERSNPLSSKGN